MSPVLVLSIGLVVLSQRDSAPPSEQLIRLQVNAMPAPKPALRYLLLPELKEMAPGNPIEGYLACLLDQDFSKPMDALGATALRRADRAARMDRPDWQTLARMRVDGILLLLPEVQKMRELARALQDRLRGEMKQRRFDDAIGTLKTMLAISRHLGEHPTLIGELVGMAIAHIALATLEEMLEQPGCPNLYWALTSLPDPLIRMHPGMEGERLLMEVELQPLTDARPMTPAELGKVLKRLQELLKFDEPPGGKAEVTLWMLRHTGDEKFLGKARKRLVEYGLPEERVSKFSPAQVALLDLKRDYEIYRDESMKLFNLPTWQYEQLAEKVPEKGPPLLGVFAPAFRKVRLAQGRIEQRIALLRHVEAIRMYAAEYSGRLPTKLADITVPLPVDPFTGKPFRYEVVDNVAHLKGSPPRGMEKAAPYNLHYEILIRD